MSREFPSVLVLCAALALGACQSTEAGSATAANVEPAQAETVVSADAQPAQPETVAPADAQRAQAMFERLIVEGRSTPGSRQSNNVKVGQYPTRPAK